MKKLLNDPSKWTKGDFARKPDGSGTQALDPQASCYCLMGAISVCKKKHDTKRVSTLSNAISEYVHHNRKFESIMSASTPTFNDAPQTSFEDIQAVLDIMERTEEEWIKRNKQYAGPEYQG